MRVPGKRSFFCALGLAMVFTGCGVSHHGLRCLAPPVGSPKALTRVDDLQPTFSWEGSSDGVLYDLRVFESDIIGSGIRTSALGGRFSVDPGREIYARDGLTVTSHRIESPLKPMTAYRWTVRERRGAISGEWSTYTYNGFGWSWFESPTLIWGGRYRCGFRTGGDSED